MRVMPLYIPFHKLIVYISGIIEIIASIGVLFEKTKMISIWTIITLLILFFPVHIHMLANKKASLNFPKSILLLRLFLQFALLYWAGSYL